jgi:DNA processing protein
MLSHTEEVLYSIALTKVPQIGSIQSRMLLDQFGSALQVFRTPRHQLEKIQGIGTMRAANITNFREFRAAEKELEFISRSGISALTYNSEAYPKRLKNCPDPPPLLFYKGNANLNAKKIISIVGTRQHSTHAVETVAAFLESWKQMDILTVSGLAYGVDQLAHSESLKYGLMSVGVLAHGLDKIYPSSHHALARQMVSQGGLLTEFLSGTQPDKQNFPRRNRIVAGLCDALLVIETDIKGGSMITAELASGYNREVFAIPGRIQDEKSHGCNYLIRENKARLTMHPSDLLEFMNWDLPETEPVPVKEEAMFMGSDPDQQLLMGIIRQDGPIHIDQLQIRSGLAFSRLMTALLYLEMEKHILQLPGKHYRPNQRSSFQNLLRI